MIGQTIGEYRITDLISDKGGFGVVYKAVHQLLEQEVAIKTLHQSLTGEARFRDRFFAEAKAQARLRHPNIVAILNFFEYNGRYYIVMEYLDGMKQPDGTRLRTLADLIRQGPVPEDRALPLFRQALAAVGCAHGHGVLHRDIKPLNVLFDEHGIAKVADFGLAKMLMPGQGDYSLTRGGMGTPPYMSPEQVLNRALDARSDIYSLGITLYEMLTGQIPFKATSTTSIEEQHVSQPPPPAREVNPDITVEAEQAILKALAKDPAQRFQTSEEFAAALGQHGRARKVVVPKFCGRTSVEAEMLAREVGLHIEQCPEEYSDSTALGMVLRQEPELGALLEQDSAVRLVLSKGGKPKPVPVPNVVGKQRQEAEAILMSVGLKLAEGGEVFSREVSKGAVAEQTPARGALEPGGAIRVVLSKGPRPVAVPALGGMTLEEARRAAAELKLRLEVSGEEPSEYVAAGRVVKQSPTPGVLLPEGGAIAVVLSLGQREHPAEVPDVRGKSREDAERLVAAAGFLMLAEGEDYFDALPAGTVVEQKPVPGALLKRGEPIRLVLSRGRDPDMTVPDDSKDEGQLKEPSASIGSADVSLEALREFQAGILAKRSEDSPGAQSRPSVPGQRPAQEKFWPSGKGCFVAVLLVAAILAVAIVAAILAHGIR